MKVRWKNEDNKKKTYIYGKMKVGLKNGDRTKKMNLEWKNEGEIEK